MKKIPHGQMKKILAIKLRAMGDTILMTAPLMELREAFPTSEIHTLTLKQWAPLLSGHPAVQKTWVFERHEDRVARAKSAARIAYLLRKEKYDAVIGFHASPTSSMIAFATGAKVRSIHFHGHKARNRYSTVDVPGKGELKPMIERDMDTIRALGVEIEPGRLPQIFLSPAERAAGQDAIERLRLSGPILALGLGASRPTKCWPLEHFAMLALRWCQERSGSVLLVVSHEERLLAEAFYSALEVVLNQQLAAVDARRAVRRCMMTLDPRPVRDLAAVLSQVQLLVGNDSGPRHLAVAVNTPTVTVFGPEHPFEWHPYPEQLHPKHYIEPMACRADADPGKPAWCALRDCKVEKHRCMRDISSHRVFESALRALEARESR
jgi:ADP-heptose:LPS heptosyltransferase